MLFATACLLGGRNGKDVGMKSKPAQTDAKETEKEVRKVQLRQMELEFHDWYTLYYFQSVGW